MTDSDKPSSRPWFRNLPLLLVAFAGLAGGAFLATRDFAPEPEGASGGNGTNAKEAAELASLQSSLKNSQVLPADFRTVPSFTLASGEGEPMTESVLEGRWSLMFFGYTNCPDVCPVTLSVMKQVVDELERREVEPMQVVFATVDPVRDTPARMREYVDYFDEDFVPVSGELDDVLALTRALGIVAAFTANEEDPDAYVVDHTASMLLIDPERRVRAKFSAPHEVDTIVEDYVTLRGALS